MDDKLITALIATSTSVVITAIGYLTAIRRVRKEKVENFKIEYYKNQVEAYLEFWSLLRPFTEYEGYSNRIIKMNDNVSYIDKDSISLFFMEVNEFFYSKNGIFLSRKLRDEIFHTRDYLKKVCVEKEENLVKISNNTAKKVNFKFNQIRNITRSDIGIRDINLPIEELDLIDV